MPRPSPRCPAAVSAWSPTMARPDQPTALNRSPGAGSGGRGTAAAIGSRPATATGRRRRRAAADRLASGLIVPARAQVQVDPAALPLDLIDLAFAVVLTAGLEGQQLGVARERLEGSQQVSHGHAPSVARQHAA
jgi:hypothetical protein